MHVYMLPRFILKRFDWRYLSCIGNSSVQLTNYFCCLEHMLIARMLTREGGRWVVSFYGAVIDYMSWFFIFFLIFFIPDKGLEGMSETFWDYISEFFFFLSYCGLKSIACLKNFRFFFSSWTTMQCTLPIYRLVTYPCLLHVYMFLCQYWWWRFHPLYTNFSNI